LCEQEDSEIFLGLFKLFESAIIQREYIIADSERYSGLAKGNVKNYDNSMRLLMK